jgi:putative polyhydroxyalkanoate system protein
VSQISIRRKHNIGLEGAKGAAQKVADDLAQRYGIQSRWEGDVLSFSRSGVDGQVRVSDSEVVLDAKLGFMLSAFRGAIESHINDGFDRYFS